MHGMGLEYLGDRSRRSHLTKFKEGIEVKTTNGASPISHKKPTPMNNDTTNPSENPQNKLYNSRRHRKK
jgi:hypothetical protein